MRFSNMGVANVGFNNWPICNIFYVSCWFLNCPWDTICSRCPLHHHCTRRPPKCLEHIHCCIPMVSGHARLDFADFSFFPSFIFHCYQQYFFSLFIIYSYSLFSEHLTSLTTIFIQHERGKFLIPALTTSRHTSNKNNRPSPSHYRTLTAA